MSLLELLRGKKWTPSVEHTLIDINPPIPLVSLTDPEKQMTLSEDTIQGVLIAIDELRHAGMAPEEMMAYYLENTDRVITNLEIRDIPKAVADKIYTRCVETGLGGRIAFNETLATVALPHGISRYKRVPVIEMR